MIVSSKCSSTEYCKFELSVDGFDLGANEVTKLGLRYGRVLGTTIDVMD